jgi:hypothetical protein
MNDKWQELKKILLRKKDAIESAIPELSDNYEEFIRRKVFCSIVNALNDIQGEMEYLDRKYKE